MTSSSRSFGIFRDFLRMSPELHSKRSALFAGGLVRAKHIKQWTFYKRDETSLGKMKQMIAERV